MVCCRTRRNCHHLSTISAQLTIENTARSASTAFATGPAWTTRSRTLLPSASEVGNGGSFVFNHDNQASLGVSNFPLKNQDFLSLSARPERHRRAARHPEPQGQGP